MKEADALVEAGFEVAVVAGDYHPWGHEADEQFADREWRLEHVEYGPMASPLRRAMLSGRKRIAGALDSVIPVESEFLNLRAIHWAIPELMQRTRSIHADLYIAHYLPALLAAVAAAQEREAKVGFDAEDFHRGEFPEREQESQKARLTRWMEEKFIPRCDYLTAAAPGVGKEYAEILDIFPPTTVLNVFPLSQRSGHTPTEELAEESPDRGLSLYWYSQTIGPDRGLETVVQAMGLAQRKGKDLPPLTLSLRGSWASGYEEELRTVARSAGLDDNQIRHLDRAAPDQLVERASQHDVGLALEQPDALRARDLCITNKILAYLLAGLPVLATDTDGQRYVHDEAPEAVALCPAEDEEVMADRILRWAQSPSRRLEAADAAERAGRERFNWALEKEKFLSQVRSVLD
ncbi:glycosyltransferase involved in cell wall biosynthesis [Salinibacter ruber]|nr:glycosyltransferase involved in cell wall biosynthesis [Salinibacter ruber]MCS4145861.1 glycosyltransferase involved in cell wall biosynthesis [Salinibacter ruber]